MIKAKPKDRTSGPIDPAKLKGYVERIEAVEAEEADYKATKKDLYVEVKAAGLRPKMVRKLVKERKKTEADREDEAELELYRAALAMPGATFRSVAKDLGVPRSTLHRLVPRNKNGTEPRDAHPSQANDPAPQGVSPPRAPEAVEVASLAGTPAQLVVQDVLTLHGSQFRNADLIVASPPCQEYSYMAMPWTPAPMAGEGAGTHSDDDLAIPAHLRGPSPANRRAGA